MMLFRFLTIVVLAFSVNFCFGQVTNPKYDPILADSLGADEYGMKSYVFVILKTGTKNIEDSELRSKLFRGHMDNIGRLVKEKKLVVAGPFGKNDKTYRGLFILNVRTLEEAKILCDSDPAVEAGIFDVEMFEWYGSAALGEYIKISERISKTKI
ncbi:MAG TPA: YciI family protein [Saprospiraceae bacterium]|nr:YciI family protein [Saprospiraceae bacterium]